MQIYDLIMEDGVLEIPERFITKYGLYPGAEVVMEEVYSKESGMNGIAIMPLDLQ